MYEESDLGHDLSLDLRASGSVPGLLTAGELAPIWTGIKNPLYLTGRVAQTLPEAKTNERQHQELAVVLDLSWGT
jgi:hypothetical protein